MGKEKEREQSPFAVDLTRNERLEAENADLRTLLGSVNLVIEEVSRTVAEIEEKRGKK